MASGALGSALATVSVVGFEVNALATADIESCLTGQLASTVGADLAIGTLGTALAAVSVVSLEVHTKATAVRES